MDVFIFDGGNQSARVFSFVIGRLVQTGDDHIQLREDFIVKVQAILEDIDLDTGQQTEIRASFGQFFIDFPDFGDLIAQTVGIQSVGLKR